MKKMKIIRLCNTMRRSILSTDGKEVPDQKGAKIMKKIENKMVCGKGFCPQYLSGVPGTERLKYWSGSPWSVFLTLASGSRAEG